MISPDRGSVVHSIERRHFIHPHRRHFQYLCHLVHHTDAREAMLSLAEVEEGHHGCFLVLRGITLEDLGDDFLADGIEFEGD